MSFFTEVKITDGTNIESIKAASTPAAATDTSVVVQLNPEQPALTTPLNVSAAISAGTITAVTSVTNPVTVVGAAATGSPASGNPVQIAGLNGGGDVFSFWVNSSGQGTNSLLGSSLTAPDDISNTQNFPIDAYNATDIIIRNFPYIFNGTTWDRTRSGGATGVTAVGGAGASGATSVGNPVLVGGLNGSGNTYSLWAGAAGSISASATATIFISADGEPNTINVSQDILNNYNITDVVYPYVFNGTTWDRQRSGGATGSVMIAGAAAAGAAIAGNPVLMGGSDGTDARALLTSATGQLHVLADSGSTTAVTGVVEVAPTGSANTLSNPFFNVLADNSGHALTVNSTATASKYALDQNILSILGTAPTTAGFLDIKGADGNVFVRQTTGTNLHTVVDSGTITTVSTVTAVTTVTNPVKIEGNGGATLDAAINTTAPTNAVWTTNAPATAAAAALTPKSVASTAQAVLKASAGNLYGLFLLNLAEVTTTSTVEVMYIHFFNTTTTTSLATSSWLFNLPIPASTTGSLGNTGQANPLCIPPGLLALANFTSGIVIVINTTSASNTTASGTAPVGVVWVE